MNLKSELDITQAAGGMIGDATRAQWVELLEKQGPASVRIVIGKLRDRLQKRQVSVGEVAKEMKHALKAEVGATVELAAVAQASPSAPPARYRITTGDEADDQVDEDDAEEHPPADEPKARPEGSRQRRDLTDWAAVLREFPGITVTEMAARAGATTAAASTWVWRSGDKLVAVGVRPRRYWLSDDPRAPSIDAPADREQAAPMEESSAGAPEVFQPSTDTATAGEAPAAVLEPASFAEVCAQVDATPRPPLANGQDLRERLVDRKPDPILRAEDLLAVAITVDELAGPLRPLLERFLDACAQRRGYAYVVRELAANRDLVVIAARSEER